MRSLLRCPKCGSLWLRRSHRAWPWDYLAGLFFFRPYRCKKCKHRFVSSRAAIHKLIYAHCPRCGNWDLQPISAQKVPTRWFKTLNRTLHRRAYRCDPCRWRFFDMRRLAPQETEQPPHQESGAPATQEQPVSGQSETRGS